MVQSIRSNSVAHRKSEILKKTLIKYGLNESSNEQKIKTIVNLLTKSLKIIASEITQ
jgi:hypothetical protein